MIKNYIENNRWKIYMALTLSGFIAAPLELLGIVEPNYAVIIFLIPFGVGLHLFIHSVLEDETNG